jgi:TATA-binding protein-associated factor Taf7
MLDDEKKEKKKKNGKSKKKEEKLADFVNEQLDKEIEEFRKKIESETKHAGLVRKVKPLITCSWIEFISNNLN